MNGGIRSEHNDGLRFADIHSVVSVRRNIEHHSEESGSEEHTG
jgi:hypothetical protein|tara:strand:+ start:2103 stop:2231 length:129 start_codon:yes stop_codon:yes gene_type:complete